MANRGGCVANRGGCVANQRGVLLSVPYNYSYITMIKFVFMIVFVKDKECCSAVFVITSYPLLTAVIR